MNLSLSARMAARSLRRGGQRSALAILCVAFGVMMLIALQTPAVLLSRELSDDSPAALGGDMKLTRGAPLTAEAIAQLDRLRAEGVITDYTLLAEGGRLIPMEAMGFIPAGFVPARPQLHSDRSGETAALHLALGVDPAAYPLAGAVTLRDGVTLAGALAAPGGAVVTADLAERMGLRVGDSIHLIGMAGPVGPSLRVAGVVTSYPAGKSAGVLYSLDTARLLGGGADVANGALVRGGPAARALLERGGWQVTTPALEVERARDGAIIVNTIFRGAGLLGLIITTFGVLSTAEMLLARRAEEIAVLKAMGYKRRDLLALFGVEMALLGAAGSLLGALAALGPSIMVTTFFSRVAPFLVVWRPDPAIFGGGMAAGFAATLAAGIFAIVRASDVRPAMLLRNLPGPRARGRAAQMLGLSLMLLATFGAIGGVMMGSLALGVAVVAALTLALGLLALVCGAALALFTGLPLPAGPTVTAARRNLRRQGRRALAALLALFLGVFAMGTSAAALGAAPDLQGAEAPNVVIAYTAQDVAALAAATLLEHGASAPAAHYEAAIQATGPDGALLGWAGLIAGFEAAPEGLELAGTAWGAEPDGVYIPAVAAGQGLAAGATLSVAGPDGEAHALRVVGTYRLRDDLGAASGAGGLLTSAATARRIGGAATVAVTVAEAPGAAKAALRAALPGRVILDAVDLGAQQRQFADNMRLLTISVAGLALLAGAGLIANTVGLAMLERRREIGIFKAMGYTSGRVLGGVLVEYGLLGAVGGGLGAAGAAAVVAGYNASWPGDAIPLQPWLLLLMAALGVAVALGAAALVAWRPARIRPLAVLRDA